jgi:hypothetical protein
MVELTEEYKDEIKDLMERGFEAAWVKDLKVGDIFYGMRIFSFDPPRQLFVVDKIWTYNDFIGGMDEEDEVEEVRVAKIVVTDEDGLQRHLAWGTSNEIYIWQGKA